METKPHNERVQGHADEKPKTIGIKKLVAVIRKPPYSGLWLIGLAIFVGFWIIFYLARVYREYNAPKWAEFLATNTFSLLLLTAMLIQAYIYFRQWKIMSMAIDPRLRVTKVRVENLEVGREPVFIVSIINDGATDASNVSLQIRVNLREGERLAMKWSHPQVVTIPAHQEQHYPLVWKNALQQELIDEINQSVPLKVSGYFQLPGHEQRPFCYLYFPWKGKRPKDVDQFIPCDLNLGLTHVMKAKAGGYATVMGEGAAIHGVIAKESKKAEDEKPA